MQGQQWCKLHNTGNIAYANILKGLLEENGIATILLNKQDSSYPVFGEMELYVPMHLKELAQQVINKTILN